MTQAARTPDAPRVAPEDPTIPIPDRQLAGAAVAPPSPSPSRPAHAPAKNGPTRDPSTRDVPARDPSPHDPSPKGRRPTDLRPRLVAGLFAIAVIAIAAGRLTDDDPPAAPSPDAAQRDPADARPVTPAPAPAEPAVPAAATAGTPAVAAADDADGPAGPRSEPTTIPAATPASTPSLTRASLARRECMAQVEAGRLFIGQARQATDRGDYEGQVTREIERLAASRAISEYRLTLVSIRMWGLRDGEPPAAPWWTDQYRRCEATRLRGGEYVVGS